MLYAVSKDEMRKIDRITTEQWLMPEILLMENAACAIVNALERQFLQLTHMRIVVLAGSGNNGGDALAVARHLHNRGVRVKVFLLAERELSACAQQNMQMLEKLDIKIYSVENSRAFDLLKAALNNADMVLDGLFGTGINRPLSDKVQAVLGIVNKRVCKKIAIDIPSGLNSDTGKIMGSCFQAEQTITLQLPKRGFYWNDGPSVCGKITIVNMNIPMEAIAAVQPELKVIDASCVKFKERPRDSHKGTYGHVLAIGGAVGTGGAVVLCAKGAQRSGAGLISAAVPGKIYPWIAAAMPEVMVHPLGQEEWVCATEEEIGALVENKSVVAIGNGMGKSTSAAKVVQMLLQKNIPLVLDADALNLLAEHDEWDRGNGIRILTPHPKEMARLCAITVEEVQNNRLQVAKEYAQKHGVWVVLKGCATIVAAPNGALWVNSVDSVALAKAGSGDVLCGVIAGLLAQGYSPEEACTMGVYLHGAAGVYLEQTVGAVSSQAGDIVEALPRVIKGE